MGYLGEVVVDVADILVRDMPDDVLADIDVSAARLGISRVEFVRRQLIREARRAKEPVTAEHLRRSYEQLGGLRDEELMKRAWQ
jgi:hypothetical protein